MHIIRKRHQGFLTRCFERFRKFSEKSEKFSEDIARRSEDFVKRSEDIARRFGKIVVLPHHKAENSRRPFWWIMQGGGIK